MACHRCLTDGTRRAHLNAAANGHLHCLQASLADRPLTQRAETLSLAAGHSLPCLAWLLDRGTQHNPASLAKDAALHGRPETLRFLLERNGSTPGVCRAAASCSLACLQVAREHNCPWGGLTEDDFFPYLEPRPEDAERLAWAREQGWSAGS